MKDRTKQANSESSGLRMMIELWPNVRTGQDASRQPHAFHLSNINTSADARQRIAPALMSLPDEPPASPSPSSGCGSVEVTGVLAVTSFSTTLDFDPEWSLSQVAHDLRGRLSDNAQQLFELDSPLGLCGLDIFKCLCYTMHFGILSYSLTNHNVHSC